MLRNRVYDLERWASHPARKPLVVRGARQVGKSWLIRSWGTQRFGGVAELNLERRPEAAACFTDNDPLAVLRRLEVILGRVIPSDGSVALFLDEVQAVPEVLAKLRWFAEELPRMPVIAAGSLLDFALVEHRFSMPVGRISYLHLEPMGFLEFCHACGEERLAAWIHEAVTVERIRAGTAMPIELHDKALSLFRAWVLVGGMPAAVEAYRGNRSFADVAEVHRELLATFRDDFAKYANRSHHRRLTAILDAVPAQLGQKFTYAKVDRDERAAVLKQALELLTLARVCHRVVSTPATGLPVAAGADQKINKVIHLDIGLASTSLRLDLSTLEKAEDLDLINSGAIAEQAVGQLLRLTPPSDSDPALWYWVREQRGASAEIDYITDLGGGILPVEVKAGAGGALRSLHLFMATRRLPWAVRFNSAPPIIQDIDVKTPADGRARYRLLSLPTYLVEVLPALAAQIHQAGPAD